MHKRSLVLPAILAAVVGAAVTATLSTAAVAEAPPVGPLPKGPVQTVKRAPGATFTVTLPKPGVAGRVWRVARAYDSAVVREEGEGERANGEIWVTYRAIGPGTTRVVFALTLGEREHAYAARTFAVAVTAATVAAGCPTGLLPLTANPLGPAVTAALVGDTMENRPQATAAAIATADPGRGGQVKDACGTLVQQRTVVVHITDRALLPSQSAAQRVLFVGRTSAGYRVWKRAH